MRRSNCGMGISCGSRGKQAVCMKVELDGIDLTTMEYAFVTRGYIARCSEHAAPQ